MILEVFDSLAICLQATYQLINMHDVVFFWIDIHKKVPPLNLDAVFNWTGLWLAPTKSVTGREKLRMVGEPQPKRRQPLPNSAKSGSSHTNRILR